MNNEERVREMLRAAHDEAEGAEATGWGAFMGRAHRALYVRRAVVGLGAASLVVVAVVGAQAVLGDRNAIRTQPVPPAGTEVVSSPQPSDSPVWTSETDRFDAEIWQVQKERLSWGLGSIAPTKVVFDENPQLGYPLAQAVATLRVLLDVPPGTKTTAIPAGTKLLGITEEGGVATVDLAREFESGGGSLSMSLRVAQVVYTVTQFEGIDAVAFEIEGKPREAIGGEGIVVSPPVDRSDFYDVAPAILVDHPTVGSRWEGSVGVEGTADVFEANVSIRILDENGKVLAETFTTATCGTGCRGDFAKDVAFEVNERQRGTVEVLTYSAEDGSPENKVSIRVILLP